MGRLCMDLYLKHLKKRYIGADRATKALILDEFCKNSGFHSKHPIRLLSKKLAKRTSIKKAADGTRAQENLRTRGVIDGFKADMVRNGSNVRKAFKSSHSNFIAALSIDL